MNKTLPSGLTRAGRCALVCDGVTDKQLEAIYLDGGLNFLIDFLQQTFVAGNTFLSIIKAKEAMAASVTNIHEFRVILLQALKDVDGAIALLPPKQESENATVEIG